MTTANILSPDVRPVSDHSVLVSFGNTISRELHGEVRRSFDLLLSRPLAGVTNLHPAYSSLLISFDPRRVKALKVVEFVRSLLSGSSVTIPTSEPAIEMPVCYDEELGPDIVDVAALHNLQPEEIIQKHTSVDYLVYFLGFSPGFPYLGDLPEALATPRLSTPRVKVPAGSVAIGGNQTGIYPIDSPGGWRIIGRTPRKMFFPDRNPPTLLHMGATVRFAPITKNEYHDIFQRENG
jgi:inhibitor of KinA